MRVLSEAFSSSARLELLDLLCAPADRLFDGQFLLKLLDDGAGIAQEAFHVCPDQSFKIAAVYVLGRAALTLGPIDPPVALLAVTSVMQASRLGLSAVGDDPDVRQIGRASCRERV